jgi:hypothetical protein
VITDEMVGDLLTQTFSVMAEDVPNHPPLSWVDAKAQRSVRSTSTLQRLTSVARRHRGWTFSLALLVGVGGAGAAAAASGAFSSPASHTFKQDLSIPVPAAFGQLPAFNPAKERLEVVDPGPEGTTISVYTYPESSSILCIAAVESKAGKATFPGKPAEKVPVGGCSGGLGNSPPPGTVPPPMDRTYGANGGIWRAPSGELYFVRAGNSPSGATSVELKLSDGTVRSASIRNGWFAIALPYNLAFGFTGTFYGSHGAVVPGIEKG